MCKYVSYRGESNCERKEYIRSYKIRIINNFFFPNRVSRRKKRSTENRVSKYISVCCPLYLHKFNTITCRGIIEKEGTSAGARAKYVEGYIKKTKLLKKESFTRHVFWNKLRKMLKEDVAENYNIRISLNCANIFERIIVIKLFLKGNTSFFMQIIT